MNYSPLPAEPIELPDPADPSHLPSSVRAAVLKYQLENVEHGKQSIKGEANQALSRPLDLAGFLCRGGRLRPPPARSAGEYACIDFDDRRVFGPVESRRPRRYCTVRLSVAVCDNDPDLAVYRQCVCLCRRRFVDVSRATAGTFCQRYSCKSKPKHLLQSKWFPLGSSGEQQQNQPHGTHGRRHIKVFGPVCALLTAGTFTIKVTFIAPEFAGTELGENVACPPVGTPVTANVIEASVELPVGGATASKKVACPPGWTVAELDPPTGVARVKSCTKV
jgi:hypothetical protein